jgi:hypothetical protein
MKCACQSPGTCATQCAADFCAGAQTQPSAACAQCLQGATQCDQQAAAACDADAACKKADACVQASGCDSKPDQ